MHMLAAAAGALTCDSVTLMVWGPKPPAPPVTERFWGEKVTAANRLVFSRMFGVPSRALLSPLFGDSVTLFQSPLAASTVKIWSGLVGRRDAAQGPTNMHNKYKKVKICFSA